MIQRIVIANENKTINTEQNKTHANDINYIRTNSFTHILNNKLTPDEVTFSAHALTRLEQRNIVVDEQIKAQLDTAIEKIALKGGKESLVMLDDIAYLVSIPNKKVITALGTNEENIFTNIDSAFLAN